MPQLLTKPITSINTHKIYIYHSKFNDIYKLHKAGNDKWSFLKMEKSTGHGTGVHWETAEECVNDAIIRTGDVFEFKNLREFILFYLNNIKK